MTDSMNLGIFSNMNSAQTQQLNGSAASAMQQNKNSSAAETALQSNQSSQEANTGAQFKTTEANSKQNETNKSQEPKESTEVNSKDKNQQVKDKKTEDDKETKDFKEVMDKKVKGKDESKDSEEKTTEVKTENKTQNSETKETELSNEEIEEAVKEVLATISEALGTNLDIDIDLDIKDLNIKDLQKLEAAIELVREEIKTLIRETIENVAKIDMSNMADLATEAELLDDLQTIDEELSEELDSIKNQKQIKLEDSKGPKFESSEGKIDISGLEKTEEIELKQLDVEKEVKAKKEVKVEQEQEIKLQHEINLEALQKDRQQKPQEQVKQEVRIEIEKLQDKVSSKMADQIKKEAVKVEAQTQSQDGDKRVNKDGERFLDKIRFVEVEKADKQIKTDVKAKVNLDAKTKQFLIDSAKELKQMMTEKIQSRVNNVKDVNLELNIQIEDVDITDNSKSNGLSSLVNKTFQNLGFDNNIQNVKGPDLANIVQDKAQSAPVNSSQTLKFQLIPKELGKVDITINKDASGMTIKVVAETDAAVKVLKTDMANLSNALKEKGVEIKDIEVSRANSEAAQNQNQKDDFNEAREEQRKKFVEGKPHWLEEGEEESFDSQLEGIMKTWN